MLRKTTLRHLVQHGEHFLNGGKVLSLNDFFEEFRIPFHKIRNTLPNGIFRFSIGHPPSNVTKCGANVTGSYRRIVFQGACLCFCGGFRNALALYRR
jgi:hypothetical protein